MRILYLSVFILFLSSIAIGQVAVVKLSPVIVTATRVPTPLTEIAQPVTIITKEEIERLPARDVAEVLRLIPYVVVDRPGWLGYPASAIIQGSKEYHVTVMIDGIPLNLNTEGIADLSQLPIEDIEKIEILKGASSALWGSALGGVINIITSPPGKTRMPKVGLCTSYGEDHTHRHEVSLSGSLHRLGYFFSGSYAATGGYRPKSEFEGKNFLTKFGLTLERGDLTLWGSYNDGNGGIFEFPEEKRWSERAYEREIVGLKADYAFIENLNTSFGLHYLRQKNEIYNYPIGGSIPFLKIHSTENTIGFTLNSNYKLSNFQCLIGTDIDRTKISDIKALKTYFKSVTKKAFYINNLFSINPFIFNLGGRFDDHTVFGSRFSPSFGIVWDMPHDFRFRFHVGRSFAYPPLSYTYVEIPPFQLANPGLKAERAWIFETGIEKKYHIFEGNINFYYARVRDAVERRIVDQLDGMPVYKPINVRQERRLGIEGRFQFNLPFGINMFYNGNFNDIVSLDKSETIPYIPRIVHKIGLDYGYKTFSLSIRGHYTWWNMPSRYKPNDRHLIWDGKATIHLFKSCKAFISVYNIFNTGVWYLPELYQPDRKIEVGIRFDYGL